MSFRTTFHIVTAMLFAAGSAGASMITVDIHDSSGDIHSVDVASTAEDVVISLPVYVTSDFDIVSLSLKVESTDGTGIFALTARTWDPAWGDQALSFTSPDNMTGAPRGRSSQRIGCLTIGTSVPAGTSRFVTISGIVKKGTPGGDYHLNLASVMGGGLDSVTIDGTAGQAYTVHVLPEPASLLLVAGAGILFRRRRVQA